jgi:hypothetical protein
MPKAKEQLQILLGNDFTLVVSALTAIEQIHWLTATVLPQDQLKRLESAASHWGKPKMVDWFAIEALEEAFASRFGDKADEISALIGECVNELQVPHHTAIRTCRLYCQSVLVKDWCPGSGDILAAMVGLYQNGAIVVSDVVFGKSMQALGRAPFVWA